MHLTWLMILSIIGLHFQGMEQKEKNIFISPLKIPLLFSANFGELRPDHYHSGIDIKTQGSTGKEVVAAADGYISRISVSPTGFGRALYITHPSGFTTVYGHLEKFAPEIEEYVTTEQYRKKSFMITLFPPRDKFRYSQGSLIAYSGNSGSSGGPHLHYEIRRTDGERPVNPFFFEFGARDNVRPVLEKLVVYPISGQSEVNGQNSVKILGISGGNGRYTLAQGGEIKIHGLTGFGIRAYDLLNDSYNKCAVYSIELEVDSVTIFKYIMDSFSFTESRYVNSHIDYEIYKRENYYVERAFRLPNDRLGVYKKVINRGLYNFRDSGVHRIKLTVTDIHLNSSVLSFAVRAVPPVAGGRSISAKTGLVTMPYNKVNRFSSDGVSFSIPSGALYDTLYFSYSRTAGKEGMLSDIHQIHNKYTPVHKACILRVRPDIVPAGKEPKMLLAVLDENSRRSPVTSRWSDGELEADVLAFGNYFVTIDTIPPVITPFGFADGANLSGRENIRFKINDDFSGIRSYTAEIDGKWYLLEYDPKNNLLTGDFDERRISKGSKHNLILRVSDSTENESIYKCTFTW